MLQWPEEELQKFAADVEDGLRHAADKQKRLSLSSLVGLLDSIPTNLLEVEGLEEARQALKKFSRLPREDKVRELLLKMQGLADQAIAKHIAFAGDAPAATGNKPMEFPVKAPEETKAPVKTEAPEQDA